MESVTEQELVLELTTSRGLLVQLVASLNSQSTVEQRKLLASKMDSSIEKAIYMAKSISSKAGYSKSSRSEDSSHPFEVSKKRKIVPKWTSQLTVSTGEDAALPQDDGYSWRKYGQKVILGAKYPRGYFRCTHRNTRGCLAIKQVQRSDENSSLFKVTYRGAHTCHHMPHVGSSSEPEPSQNHPEDKVQQQQQFPSFPTSLTVKPECLRSEELGLASLFSPDFSFQSTPMSCLRTDKNIFSPHHSALDNCFMGSLSPSFISPATSELSPCNMSSNRGGMNLNAAEYDFNEIISAETSAIKSPATDMDFFLESLEFDKDITSFSELSPFNMSSNRGGINLNAAEFDFNEIISAETSAIKSPVTDMDFFFKSLEFDQDITSFFLQDL